MGNESNRDGAIHPIHESSTFGDMENIGRRDHCGTCGRREINGEGLNGTREICWFGGHCSGGHFTMPVLTGQYERSLAGSK